VGGLGVGEDKSLCKSVSCGPYPFRRAIRFVDCMQPTKRKTTFSSIAEHPFHVGHSSIFFVVSPRTVCPGSVPICQSATKNRLPHFEVSVNPWRWGLIVFIGKITGKKEPRLKICYLETGPYFVMERLHGRSSGIHFIPRLFLKRNTFFMDQAWSTMRIHILRSVSGRNVVGATSPYSRFNLLHFTNDAFTHRTIRH
jgi:hypothetical protein